MMEQQWLTVAEAARFLPHTSEAALRRWCQQGQVPGAVRLPNRRWIIPVAAVEALLAPSPGVAGP